MTLNIDREHILKLLSGFIILIIIFGLTAGSFKYYKNKLLITCYIDKDNDGFGSMYKEPIKCYFKCKNGYTKNDSDIDDSNSNCAKKGDKGCIKDQEDPAKYKIELTEFSISNRLCSTEVKVRVKNTGNKDIKDIKLSWDPDIYNPNNTFQNKYISNLKIGREQSFSFRLGHNNLKDFLPGKYNSLLSITHPKEKETFKSNKGYTLQKCETPTTQPGPKPTTIDRFIKTFKKTFEKEKERP